LKVLALTMVGATLLLACGSSASSNGTSSGGGGVMTIGCTLPETGIYSAFGRYYVDAYNLWVKETNAKGGLLGKKVQLTIYDDKSDAPTAVSLYEKLLTVDKVDFIVGGFPTPVLMPVLGVAERFHKLFIQGGANADPLIVQGGYKHTFTTMTGSTIWADSLIDWLKALPSDQRPKKAAFVQEVNPFLQSTVAVSTPEVKALGIDVFSTETFSSDTQDFTAMIQKFKANGVDFVFVANNIPAGESFMRAMAEQQFHPKLVYMAAGPSLPAWISALGVGTDSVMTSVPYWNSLQRDGNAQFVKDTQQNFNYLPTRESGMAYTVMQVLALAINGAKTLDQDKLRQYVATHEFDTVSGKMKFDSHGLSSSGAYLMQVQGTQQFLVWPKAVQQKNAVYPRQ
jgi:branched-chain amino acid transport system substrate-binding protein